MTEHTQQHPLKVYLWVWAWLFLFSLGSYMADIAPLDDAMKWALILLFMVTKAALIIAVFMHMVWERLAIVLAIFTPPGVLLFAVLILALEAEYTISSRLRFFFGG